MVLNSFPFLVIFPIIFLLYYIIPARFNKGRNLFLLITSYLLYLNWKPIYALILLGVTIITFLTALLLKRIKKKKTVVILGTFTALLPLLFFKYYNFVNDQVFGFLSLMGIDFKFQGLNWAIPVGISFFSLQAISYVHDVYFKRIDIENNFLDYALFISFFPSILSGPINRASEMLPQIKGARQSFDYSKVVQGLRLCLWGLFMKVVVADNAGLYVDSIFNFYQNYTGIECFWASLLFTIQIYADFGGYSLLAIGVGKMLGFDLAENFKRPYFSESVTDFWRRWHISFSTWLKDYIYIPLGGNRCSKFRNYFNIFFTFLVSGIWHGANWTFIIWGLLHGVAQIFERIIGNKGNGYSTYERVIHVLFTFLFVNFALIIFRMPSLNDGLCVIKSIFSFKSSFVYQRPNIILLIMIVILFAKDFLEEYFPGKYKVFDSNSMIIRWSSYLLLIVIILLFGVLGSDNFIYANF